MTERPPEPDPVDLDKLTTAPPAPDVPQPRWRRGAHGPECTQCGRRPNQHHNGASHRWWACWEIDAIQAEVDYWALPWYRRISRRRPPELMADPDYVPGQGMHPTRLVEPDSLRTGIRRLITRG